MRNNQCERSNALTFGVLFVGTAAALSNSGCSGDIDGESESRATTEPLYYLTSKLWDQRDIPVCWVTAGNATEKGWVRDTLRGQRSWSSEGNLSFVGWGACSSQATGIKISGGSTMVTSYLARSDSGIAEMTLDFGVSPQNTYTRCSANGLTREQCIKTAALHEFGHAIGYAHEQNRSDTPASCAGQAQGTNGDATFGSWDGNSITAYCNFPTELSGIDRRGTDRLYGQRYGNPRYIRDYNADGRADLLCHDVVNGDKYIDYADVSGQFLGTDWSRAANWCSHDKGRIFTGDFNGDSRADLLCHDVANGDKYIDYADSSGRFLGTNWSRAANWCGHEAGRLFIGDFNGDGRDDLLCHDVANGDKYIDFADTSGQFLGTNWSFAANWCSHDAGELHVGDFNGDGRHDILCHDVADGDKWVDYSDSSGRFLGTDWTRAANWCRLSAQRLFVGDFNGDGRDDLFCHNVANGDKFIDYADNSGQFFGTNWSLAADWCSHEAGELL